MVIASEHGLEFHELAKDDRDVHLSRRPMSYIRVRCCYCWRVRRAYSHVDILWQVSQWHTWSNSTFPEFLRQCQAQTSQNKQVLTPDESCSNAIDEIKIVAIETQVLGRTVPWNSAGGGGWENTTSIHSATSWAEINVLGWLHLCLLGASDSREVTHVTFIAEMVFSVSRPCPLTVPVYAVLIRFVYAYA